MQNFKSYLLAMHIAGPKAVDFYLHWVTQFYRFLNKQPRDTVTQQEMDSSLKRLSKSRESWQVDQAAKAISLYQFFITKYSNANLHFLVPRNNYLWRYDFFRARYVLF